ncbi:MAG: hypothetical protein AB6733_20610 [Clostridiaceae bacterium]
MKKFINSIGVILISLNIIYTIMIIFLNWTVKKEIVIPTLFLTAIYVIYRLFLDKNKKDSFKK